MSRTILDFHVLHTVPPSNINRDDTGSPKTAVHGGVRRARVSSQAWKRATRSEFSRTVDTVDLGDRTRRVVELLARDICEIAPELADQSNDLSANVLLAAGITIDKPKRGGSEIPESGYLLFLSRRQRTALARLAVEVERAGGAVDKNEAKRLANREQSIDIALFGRMIADAPDLNVDASAQVAHAISVHGVDNEYDYFTAVDDYAREDNAGAGMIGTVEFNSSTLYRYATVDVNALQANLGSADAAGRAVAAFARAFITSMPTGKQNTFANRTLPEGVVVLVREDQPVNLVGAFEDPVGATASATRVAAASERLADHADEIDRAYSQRPVAAWVVRVGASTVALDRLGENTDLNGLVGSVRQVSEERLRDNS